jgi:hypothetical protein
MAKARAAICWIIGRLRVAWLVTTTKLKWTVYGHLFPTTRSTTGRARWWRSRLRSETGGSEQGRYILCHSAIGGLTSMDEGSCRPSRFSAWNKFSRGQPGDASFKTGQRSCHGLAVNDSPGRSSAPHCWSSPTCSGFAGRAARSRLGLPSIGQRVRAQRAADYR